MSDVQIQLEQLDTWERAMEEGRTILQEAMVLQSEAEQAQAERRWDEAASKFRHARTMYGLALTRLNVPAEIGQTSYKALNALRDEANRLLQQANNAAEEHDRTHWAEMCERNMTMALDFLQQARTALEEQNFAAARMLASQAKDMDPSLLPEAERTIRASGEIEAEGQQRATRRIVLLSALVVFLVIGAVVGVMQLWGSLGGF